MSYTTQTNCYTQHGQILGFGLTSKKGTRTSVSLMVCPPYTKEITIDYFRCLVFIVPSVLITGNEAVCHIADTAEMVHFALFQNKLNFFVKKILISPFGLNCKKLKTIYNVDKKSETTCETCSPLLFIIENLSPDTF